jgi:hypothetical protein
MLKNIYFVSIIIVFLAAELKGQPNSSVTFNLLKKESNVSPGDVINLALFIKNNSTEKQNLNALIKVPDSWKIINPNQEINLAPSEKKFLIYTLQVPSNFPVGEYGIQFIAIQTASKDTVGKSETSFKVNEVENIKMILVNSPEHVVAGDTLKVTYLLQNQGNTIKKIFIETQNCHINGSAEIEIQPGATKEFTVYNPISNEIVDVQRLYYTVRAVVSGKVYKSIFREVLIFPSKNVKKDLFFRFPVSFSATYLTSNQNDKFESGYQFQLSGSGMLDPEGKHKLEFLARGPNNSNLSYLGMYDQYYVSYENKNLELFVGEKSFRLTPLTESSRFGMGTENRIIFNNGLSFGFMYIKPRFFSDIKNELAGFTSYEINKENTIAFYYVTKKNDFTTDLVHLVSINTALQPLKKTALELELSRGTFQGVTDNAFRAMINSQLSIFRLAGNYYYTGKNYPGYYSNSTFYSGNISARLTSKLSIGVYSREDFKNAELDTLFVTAPYSRSFQTFMNYNPARQAYFKLYWRTFERKDRLVLNKFHYLTQSINTQFDHRFRKIEYTLTGEYGKTTNYLLDASNNRQTTYRGSFNLGYRFNTFNAIRVFGNWSNINSFVSGEQRNLIAGISAVSQISKNLSANIHIQNAYNIDDYYRNRNLMQLNLDYTFLRKHKLSLRSFYTIFKQQVDNPELTLSLNYAYNFGIPVKQVIKGGDIKGRITYDNDEPAEGIILNLQNKTVITDKNGDFWFKTVPPGKHLLVVDRSSFEIDEITSISTPIEMDVVENQISTLNFKITKGARLTGKFIIERNKNILLDNLSITAGNIVVELKNDFEQFRIATDKAGNYSFPMVSPGKWIFKIYTTSIPSGYEISPSIYNIELKAGEEKSINPEIKLKKRKIIFKSQNTTLSASNTLSVNGNDKMETKQVIAMSKDITHKSENGFFYSIQIGAFRKPLKPDSRFLKGEQFDYEIQINNLYKYYIGKYSSYKKAQAARGKLKLKFEEAFIVTFKNGNPMPLTK